MKLRSLRRWISRRIATKVVTPRWDLTTLLPRVIGITVIKFADEHNKCIANGDELENNLRKHGAALIEFADREWELEGSEYAELHRRAVESMTWIGRNLPYMWY